jgi:hypothetical protein
MILKGGDRLDVLRDKQIQDQVFICIN